MASAPPTRVVFFVANAGKPRLPAASDCVPLAPTVGVVAVRAPTPPRSPPQATAVSAHSARTAIRSARRRIQSRKIASGAQMNDDVYSSFMDFRLSDEQLAFQRHCHAFARDVMRPAAARYDREQTVPYDVIREARARGLHGMPYLERVGADETGLMNAIYAEELHWGCAGIGLAISGSSLAAAGIASTGTPDQVGRWVPACFGTGDEIRFWRLRGDGGGRRLRRQLVAHDRPPRRRRVGAQRREGLHLQRRDRRRQRRRRDGRPGARPPRPGLLRRREGHAGLPHEVQRLVIARMQVAARRQAVADESGADAGAAAEDARRAA